MSKSHQKAADESKAVSEAEPSSTNQDGSSSNSAAVASASSKPSKKKKPKKAVYSQFEERCKKYFPDGLGKLGTPKQLWERLLKNREKAESTLQDGGAYTDATKVNRYTTLDHDQANEANNLFFELMKDLIEKSFNAIKDSPFFGFWSGLGKEITKESGGSMLENTQIGEVFDDLGSLDGGRWDPEVWGALSREYAKSV